ncbi:MAG: sugar phosphate isomerase/epimerase family protein [Opitutaceae bacterium]|nr:sugar phosphate isomerase/epimerase family protein [Opitutaceae bacterium]
MQIGFCTDPATLAALPARPDCDFIEGHVVNFLKPEAPDAEFAPHAAALSTCGYPMPAANVLLPAALKCSGPDIDYARLDRYAQVVFRRAKETGMKFIVFGSAGARMVPPGFPITKAFEQYVDILRQFGPLAEEHGVTIVVEPLNRGECNLVNTVLEGAEAVRRANHTAVKLLVDIFHMLRNDESPDDIVKVAPLIRHAHIAENKDRAAPGVNGENLRPYLRALHQAGYNDRLALEPIWTDLPNQIGPALAELKKQLTDSGY